jgi:GR25 family glycosyltransferase involved in LPS biosynthesis
MTLDRVALINLDRSTDRLGRFKIVNGFLPGAERFAAVDGRTLDRRTLQSTGLLDPQVSYTDGALGCALSHFTQWQRAVDEGMDVTVCEDDAVFNWGFVDKAANVLQALGSRWDIVLWGWNFDSLLWADALPGVSPSLICLDQNGLRSHLERYQALDVEPRPLKLLHAFGIMCYSVSAGGAKKLLDACRPIRAMNVVVPGLPQPVRNSGIDVMLNAVYRHIDAFVAFPPLVVSPNDRASSLIQTA